MFDQKDVEAYRRIKAPEELREQVMRLEQKPEPTRTRTKWISFGSLAAAACAWQEGRSLREMALSGLAASAICARADSAVSPLITPDAIAGIIQNA